MWPCELTAVLRRLGPRARDALPALEARLARATLPDDREDFRRTIAALRGR